MIKPKYLYRHPPDLEMSLNTLASRREFAMGLASQFQLSGMKIKELWQNNFREMVKASIEDSVVRDLYMDLLKRITCNPAEKSPFLFVAILDYALLRTFMGLTGGQIIIDDDKLYDSDRYETEKQPFFCRAGHFSYIRQKVRNTFSRFFKSESSGEFFRLQADLVKEYYGHSLYSVEESENRWVMEAKDPPEASRSDCMANIYIFYKGWIDLFPVTNVSKGKYHCREEKCVLLGDSTCRFVFEKTE